MNVPPLTLRIPKSAPLTSEEHDENLTTLRDFIDGLAKLFEVVFNADGTLKNNSVGTASILDRAITQRKLDWLANFYAVATGVDNYSATINPTTGFGYGDGAATSFFCVIKFTNANTGAADLDINTGGAKAIKKLTGENLVVGDILAGSVHLLAYDGTNFQLLSPSPVVSPSHIVGAHGIPVFITPVDIVPSGQIAVAPTVYNTLVADGVPSTASAVILECEWAIKQNAPARILIRKETGGDPRTLAYGLGDGAHTQAVAGANQGFFPVKEAAGVLSIEYEITGIFDFFYVVRLIGYIS